MKKIVIVCLVVAFFSSVESQEHPCDQFGTCSQGCKATSSGYQCTCASNFVLQDDNKSCKPINFDPILVYSPYHEDAEVLNLNTNDTNVFTTVDYAGVGEASSITYDGELIYFLNNYRDGRMIFKVHPNLYMPRAALTVKPGNEVRSVAVDWLTKNLYFVFYGKGTITACTNDGKHCKQIIGNGAAGRSQRIFQIVLDPPKAQIFWTSTADNSYIGTSSMDGSNPRILIDNIEEPISFTSDAPNGRLYWFNRRSLKVETVNMNGRDHRVIDESLGIEGHSVLSRVAVFGDRIYWYDPKENIRSVNKFTGQDSKLHVSNKYIYSKNILVVTTIWISFFAFPLTDFNVVSKGLVSPENHACMNNVCSHICLLGPNSTHTCACPDGIALDVAVMELESDGRTCKFA